MNLLFRVVYGAHASGTHHKLALDALLELHHPHAEGWRRLFIKHAETYLEGSKAPDSEFKDFKNHVLHVGERYWGGAREKTRSWYGELVAALRAERWSEAVYAAGVLSHYYVDPIHPFHTGQSEAESNIHRAVEWSISKSYDSLKALRVAACEPPTAEPADRDDWLEDLVCRNAELANRHYHTLLVHYDLRKGVVDPPAGLDPHACRTVAGLIAYASASFALVLDRAFAEAGIDPPEVTLSLETLLAVLAIPRKLVLSKLADREDRRQVEAMYDELQSRGRVDKTLAEDDRAIRDLHASEVASLTAERRKGARAAAIDEASRAGEPRSPHTDRGPRLTAGDGVEAAPSIGPKTAERLDKAGVRTVADLLAIEPEALSRRLAASHLDAGTIRSWQDQARLVLALPGLSGTQAQLLVASSYRDLDALGSADPPALSASLSRFAASAEGERMLRGGRLPEAGEIMAWIEAARRLSSKAA